jgi:hypothetical protein
MDGFVKPSSSDLPRQRFFRSFHYPSPLGKHHQSEVPVFIRQRYFIFPVRRKILSALTGFENNLPLSLILRASVFLSKNLSQPPI